MVACKNVLFNNKFSRESAGPGEFCLKDFLGTSENPPTRAPRITRLSGLGTRHLCDSKQHGSKLSGEVPGGVGGCSEDTTSHDYGTRIRTPFRLCGVRLRLHAGGCGLLPSPRIGWSRHRYIDSSELGFSVTKKRNDRSPIPGDIP